MCRPNPQTSHAHHTRSEVLGQLKLRPVVCRQLFSGYATANRLVLRVAIRATVAVRAAIRAANQAANRAAILAAAAAARSDRAFVPRRGGGRERLGGPIFSRACGARNF